MIKVGLVSCAVLAAAAGCKKGAAAGATPAQKALKAEVAGKALAPLYGVAQPDLARGEGHRLTFATRPLTCATLSTALAETRAGESFWIAVHEALRPDGSTTWAYGGIAFGDGGSAPAGLVEMASYRVDGGQVTGTLPAGVAHDDGSFGVSGSFTLPVCAPLPAPKVRELADVAKEVVPIEATGSTARVTVAGRSFDVKGATALRGRGDGAWEIRLSAQPHGCSFEVPGDLWVGLRLGDGEPKLYLGGHWIAGAANVAPLAGDLKVEAKPSEGAVELVLSGAMGYTPGDAPYAVALSGAVRAIECRVP